ncbi:unnamed protein product [Dicrocoelium dendriticum]|nr:unnamed protein product [Dicrocoelium dendriticum]
MTSSPNFNHIGRRVIYQGSPYLLYTAGRTNVNILLLAARFFLFHRFLLLPLLIFQNSQLNWQRPQCHWSHHLQLSTPSIGRQSPNAPYKATLSRILGSVQGSLSKINMLKDCIRLGSMTSTGLLN